MNHSDFLSHPLTAGEKTWGLRYLLFQTLFLSPLLQRLNALLPAPLPQTEVNLLYFIINLTAVSIIFRDFLLRQLQLLPELLWKILFVTAVGFMVYHVANFLMVQLLFALDKDFFSINDASVAQLVAENFPLMFLCTVVFAPITEECLFRGLLFRGVYDRSPVFAWLGSAALFSLAHIVSYIGLFPPKTLLLCFLQYLPAGACLAGAYRLSSSILSPILIHAMVNLLGMIALR